MRRAAEFIKDLKWQDLDEKTIQSAKNCLLDYVGAVLGGAKTKTGRIALEFGKSLGGWGKATIWPTRDRVSCQAATFVHGTMGSALDIDDGHRMAVGHPGGVVIPAAFAVAENNQCSGKRLLEAVVCGYEVGIRAGHILRSQQTQPISMGSGRWGSVGAAAAVAKLMRLSPKKIEQALAISATIAPVAPVTDDLPTTGNIPMTKFCSGWGGLAGIQGALLAQKGFTGVTSVVNFSASKLPDFGDSFEIIQTYFKPYPTCRYAHPVIEAVLELMKEHPDVKAENIQKVIVHTILNAAHLKAPQPQTMESAQYNIPFIVAAAVVDGKVGFEQIDERRLKDPAILRVAQRVEVRHSVEMDAYFPREAPAEVEIETQSGGFHKKMIIRPKGDPQNPLSEKEFSTKFMRLALRILNRQRAKKVWTAVMNLEKLPKLSEITGHFRP